MENTGWLVNDCLTCIPGTETFWHHLLKWFPKLIDKTNGYTDFNYLAQIIESNLIISKPKYIIRNGTYFRKINTDVKTISLIQDIPVDKSQQINVINNSTVAVFNTKYVYNKYKSLINSDVLIRICPLGVDFNFFRPIVDKHPDVLPNSIIFIGAANKYPKGFNIMLDIIDNMPNQNFCLVMKDNFSINDLPIEVKHRVKIFNKVDQETIRLLINSCLLAVCTSYEETQHLSGIECGACNIPIVAREVGIYHDCKEDNEWGLIATDNTFIQKIQYIKEHLNEFNPREYLIKKYSTEICKQNWINIIESI